jgi:ABC-type antimicrobial peptide transport system permease subunit
MKVGGGDEMDIEIVGLAQNAKYSDVKVEIPPLFLLPYRQDDDIGSIFFYLRTSFDPESILSRVPPTVAKLDPNLPVDNLRTMEQQVQENVTVDRIVGVLSSAFALLATLLAAVGLYGVLSYTVSQRTREIGVRMALGAAPARVRGTVLRQVVWMTLIGGVIGLAMAFGLARLAQSMLFELEGTDLTVLATATILLSLVALGAGFIPALRASQVDPMRAPRYE